MIPGIVAGIGGGEGGGVGDGAGEGGGEGDGASVATVIAVPAGTVMLWPLPVKMMLYAIETSRFLFQLPRSLLDRNAETAGDRRKREVRLDRRAGSNFYHQISK